MSTPASWTPSPAPRSALELLSAETVEDFQIQMRLSLDGIGVALSSRDGYSVVEKVIPAARPTSQGARAEGQDHRRRAGGRRVRRHHRHGLRDVVRLIRGRARHQGAAHGPAQGRHDRALRRQIVRDKIDLEERPRADFEIVEAATEAQARRPRPALLLRRPRPEQATELARRCASCLLAQARGEGGRPAARPVAQRRRNARRLGRDRRPLHPRGRRRRRQEPSSRKTRCCTTPTTESSTTDRSWFCISHERLGLGDRGRRHEGLRPRGRRRRRPHLRQGHRPEHHPAAAGPRRPQGHDRALLPTGRRLDPERRRRRGHRVSLAQHGRVRRAPPGNTRCPTSGFRRSSATRPTETKRQRNGIRSPDRWSPCWREGRSVGSWKTSTSRRSRKSWRIGRATTEWSGSPRSSASARKPTGGVEAPRTEHPRRVRREAPTRIPLASPSRRIPKRTTDPSPQVREALEILTDMITLSP